MATIVTPPAVSAPQEPPTIADLKAMLAPPSAQPEPAAAPPKEPEPPTPEVKAAEPEKVEEKPATETEKSIAEAGTAEEKQAPEAKQPVVEEGEEELPEGVKKRIAKEVGKTARIQAEIAHAVSARKAAEAELAKVTAEPGTAPEKKAEPAATDSKPAKPARPPEPPEIIVGEDEPWADYQAKVKVQQTEYRAEIAKYETKLAEYETAKDAWLLAEAERKFEQKAQARKIDEEGDRFLAEALKQHGKEVLESAIEGFKEKAPADFQKAISQLDTWPAMVIHLNAHPAELKTITDIFAASQYRGVAALGKLESSLAQKAQAPKTEKPVPVVAPPVPLPAPPAAVGGKSSPVGAIDLEKVSMTRFKQEITKRLARTG